MFCFLSSEELEQFDSDTRLKFLSEMGQDKDMVKSMSRKYIKEKWNSLKETEVATLFN